MNKILTAILLLIALTTSGCGSDEDALTIEISCTEDGGGSCTSFSMRCAVGASAACRDGKPMSFKLNSEGQFVPDVSDLNRAVIDMFDPKTTVVDDDLIREWAKGLTLVGDADTLKQWDNAARTIRPLKCRTVKFIKGRIPICS